MTTQTNLVTNLKAALKLSGEADIAIHVALVAIIEDAIVSESCDNLDAAGEALEALRFKAQRDAARVFIAVATCTEWTGKRFDGVPEWNDGVDLDAGEITVNGEQVKWWQAKPAKSASKAKPTAKADALKCATRILNTDKVSKRDALMARVIAMSTEMTVAQLTAIINGEAQVTDLPAPQLAVVKKTA